MTVTAITGDIGSGKSTAAKLLAGILGCERLDSDSIAKNMWLREDVKAQAVSRWGSEILDPSGRIILSRIAEHVFSAKSESDFCNGLIHPLVMADLQERTKNLSSAVVEIPLLPEAGRPEWADRAIYITAKFEARAQRCRSQRGWSIDELRRRESLLLPQNERIAVCEYVVSNDDGIDRLAQKLADTIIHTERRMLQKSVSLQT